MISTCFGLRHSHYSYYQYRASNIEAVDTTFKDFSYDAIREENRTNTLPYEKRMHYVLRYTVMG